VIEPELPNVFFTSESPPLSALNFTGETMGGARGSEVGRIGAPDTMKIFETEDKIGELSASLVLESFDKSTWPTGLFLFMARALFSNLSLIF
jgi:hypothetical protein